MHSRNGRLKLTAILVMWKPLQSEGIDRSSDADATIGTERRRTFLFESDERAERDKAKHGS